MQSNFSDNLRHEMYFKTTFVSVSARVEVEKRTEKFSERCFDVSCSHDVFVRLLNAFAAAPSTWCHVNRLSFGNENSKSGSEVQGNFCVSMCRTN